MASWPCCPLAVPSQASHLPSQSLIFLTCKMSSWLFNLSSTHQSRLSLTITTQRSSLKYQKIRILCHYEARAPISHPNCGALSKFPQNCYGNGSGQPFPRIRGRAHACEQLAAVKWAEGLGLEHLPRSSWPWPPAYKSPMLSALSILFCKMGIR